MSGGFPGHDTGSSAPQMPPLVRPPHPHQTPHPGPTPRDEQTVTQPIPFERPLETRATTTLETETPLGPTGSGRTECSIWNPPGNVLKVNALLPVLAPA